MIYWKLKLQYIWSNVVVFLCIKDTESKNVKAAKTNSGKLKLLSKCAVCDIKKRDLSKTKELMDW